MRFAVIRAKMSFWGRAGEQRQDRVEKEGATWGRIAGRLHGFSVFFLFSSFTAHAKKKKKKRAYDEEKDSNLK